MKNKKIISILATILIILAAMPFVLAQDEIEITVEEQPTSGGISTMGVATPNMDVIAVGNNAAQIKCYLSDENEYLKQGHEYKIVFEATKDILFLKTINEVKPIAQSRLKGFKKEIKIYKEVPGVTVGKIAQWVPAVPTFYYNVVSWLAGGKPLIRSGDKDITATIPYSPQLNDKNLNYVEEKVEVSCKFYVKIPTDVGKAQESIIASPTKTITFKKPINLESLNPKQREIKTNYDDIIKGLEKNRDLLKEKRPDVYPQIVNDINRVLNDLRKQRDEEIIKAS